MFLSPLCSLVLLVVCNIRDCKYILQVLTIGVYCFLSQDIVPLHMALYTETKKVTCCLHVCDITRPVLHPLQGEIN